MVLNKRVIDFSNLLEKINEIRLTKEQCIYHNYLQEYAGKNCALCSLPLNPYGVYLNHKQPICIKCFNDYIATEHYMDNLESFEARVLCTNELAEAFSNALKTNKQNIDMELANQLFKDMYLAEIEQMIGLPKRFGSFDYGIESGNWKLGNSRVEIWFKNQICTEVTVI